MAAIFAYTCSCCGKRHEGSPSFGFRRPEHFFGIPESQRAERIWETDDLCVIDDKDRFIRVTLEIPIHGISEPFMWGVWISLSETNFNRYLDTSGDPVEDDSWFGWFSIRLPYYPNTLDLKTSAHPRRNNQRPWIELELTDHPLTIDFHEGISVERAQEVAEVATHAFSA